MFEAELQPTGLKAGQFTLLATLSTQGEMSLTALADTLVMDRTTLTRNLKPMLRDGFVRIGAEEDQRVRMVGLTDLGAEKVAEAYPLWAVVQFRLVDDLGVDNWADLIGNLAAIVEVTKKDHSAKR